MQNWNSIHNELYMDKTYLISQQMSFNKQNKRLQVYNCLEAIQVNYRHLFFGQFN